LALLTVWSQTSACDFKKLFLFDMKIGIDAKWMFEGPVSGQVFTRNLVPVLINSFPGHEWHLFLDKKSKNRSLPFSTKNLRLHYVWSGYNMISNRFILPRIAKHEKLDLVFYQSFCGHAGNVATVVFIHDVLFESHPEFFSWKEKIYFKFMRASAGKAKMIITSSNTVKHDLVQYKYVEDAAKVVIAPLGVDKTFKPLSQHDPTAADALRKKYDLPENFILYLGRMNTRKNIGGLLEALAMTKNNLPLVIAGEKDWEQPDLVKMISNHKLHDRVKILGTIPAESLSLLYAMSTIFCFPSFAEGFGLPPLEAMASGVPVIVSRNTALQEVCGEAGWYIDPFKPATIAAAIDLLVSDKEKRDERISAGLSRASELTWNNTARKIMECFHQITGI
jgi:glycosyltransferase involved in cell wall biosynthesis